MRTRLSTLVAALLVALAVAPSAGAQDPEGDEYFKKINLWHIERESRLRSDSGWLTVSGLFWLGPTDNTFGTAPDNAVILPPGTAPAHAGAFRVEPQDGGPSVRVTVEPGVRALVDGEPVSTRYLAPDDPGPPDELTLGRLTLWVIVRKNQFGIRLRDPQARLRQEFTGIETYPTDLSYRVTGRWNPFEEPKPVVFSNEAGYTDTTLAYGEAVFELEGRELSLLPQHMAPGDSSLFFVVADRTTGTETYGGGRFLQGVLRPDGSVLLDFNKAYNPPCAFNPWTTCPLPPEENRLPVAIRAGEMDYAPAAGPDSGD